MTLCLKKYNNMTLLNLFRNVGLTALVCLLAIPTLSAQRRSVERVDARPAGNSHTEAGMPPQAWTPVSTGRAVQTPFQLAKTPALAVKTNLLYAATLTPNLGVEFALGRQTTLEISGGCNPSWEKVASDAPAAEAAEGDAVAADPNKLEHWLVKPEFRYWFKDRFNGHFVGLQAFYADFDIHGYRFPTLLKKEFYNEGTAFGGGLAYGYHWALGRHWGVEFNVAAGVVQTDYKEKTCDTCTEEGVTRFKKTYLGPIGAGMSIATIPTLLLYFVLSEKVQKSLVLGAVKG